uniref:Platelet-activating factor receptor n=1 Tax=Nothobranchius furzeri TaxID=105023 RepID=A0A1A8A188_NOTFU
MGLSEEVVVTGTPVQNSTTFLDSEFRYLLFPVIYSIFFIFGFIANFYVLFVLWSLREAKAMGEIRIYMTNLTIADLLFVCVLPFWISYYRRRGDWIFEDFMCRLTGSFFFINAYGSILFLGAISLNRYWAVTRPLDAASLDHRRRGIIVCALIWVFTISISVPYLLSPATKQDLDKIRCFEGYQNETNSYKKKSNSSTMSSSKKPRGVKRRALQMLLAVVGVFALCFLPHHIVQGPWVLAVLQITEGWGHVAYDQDTRQMLNDAHQITLALMGLNCILDPVVYFFATRKFRRFIVNHMKKIARGEACSHSANILDSVDSKHQSQRLHSIHQPSNDKELNEV